MNLKRSKQIATITENRRLGLGDLSDSDVANRQRMLAWWSERLGRLPVLELRPIDVAEQLRKLEAGDTISGRPVSVASRNRYLTALSAVLTWGAKERVYGFDFNPLAGAHLRRKEPRGRVRFLDEDERQSLLDACRESYEPRLYLLTLMAISTGMRQGELLALRWPDIDL